MQKILYVHGLGSGKNSKTLNEVKEFFDNYEVHGIEVNQNPFESVKKIQDYININHIDILIGCSLGGFYGAYINNVKYKFLVNPGFQIIEILKNKIGAGIHEYFCEREDGRTYYSIDQDVINNFRYFQMIHNTHSDNSYAIISTNDTFIGNDYQIKNIQNAYSCGFKLIFSYEFDHRINNKVLNIIKSILCTIN